MDYVQRAEKVIREMDKKAISRVTTTKIRNLLSGISDIYNDVVQLDGDELGDDLRAKIQYLKVQFIYAAGRDAAVKDFIENAHILDDIDGIGNSKKKFIDMERYMEALVAYHRFYGGRDE